MSVLSPPTGHNAKNLGTGLNLNTFYLLSGTGRAALPREAIPHGSSCSRQAVCAQVLFLMPRFLAGYILLLQWLVLSWSSRGILHGKQKSS